LTDMIVAETHVANATQEQFDLLDVWVTPEDMRRFNDAILRPRIDYAGLAVRAEVVSPVWSFARP